MLSYARSTLSHIFRLLAFIGRHTSFDINTDKTIDSVYRNQKRKTDETIEGNTTKRNTTETVHQRGIYLVSIVSFGFFFCFSLLGFHLFDAADYEMANYISNFFLISAYKCFHVCNFMRIQQNIRYYLNIFSLLSKLYTFSHQNLEIYWKGFNCTRKMIFSNHPPERESWIETEREREQMKNCGKHADRMRLMAIIIKFLHKAKTPIDVSSGVKVRATWKRFQNLWRWIGLTWRFFWFSF